MAGRQSAGPGRPAPPGRLLRRLPAFLDATIDNVAIPSIRESFPDTSIGELSWILNAYSIVLAAFLIVCGRLTDLLGRRRAFAGGVLYCASPSPPPCAAQRPRSSC